MFSLFRTRPLQGRKDPPIIEIIAVTYKQEGPLKILVQSFLNQTATNWILKVIHDGPSDSFESMMKEYKNENPDRIVYNHTTQRYNDYGHSLREIGLQGVSGDYVLLTNGDNYYVPIFIEAVSKAILEHDPDVVLFDMIHSHSRAGGRNVPKYSFFKTSYKRRSIDMGSAVVRADLARGAGFRDKTFAGDATYFEDIAKIKENRLSIKKLNQVLFVHN